MGWSEEVQLIIRVFSAPGIVSTIDLWGTSFHLQLWLSFYIIMNFSALLRKGHERRKVSILRMLVTGSVPS
jgi:hypothetical protein